MSLEDWLNNRWLHRHETSAEEIRSMLRSGREDIRSAQAEGLGNAWRLNIAYTAAHRYALAALHVSGYRPTHERSHERTIDSLAFTIPLVDSDAILLLHTIRKKRHTATYDTLEMVSEEEANAALTLAIELGDQVTNWLYENHSELFEEEE